MHSLLSDNLKDRLSNIKLLALDVDGVMTDGSVFFTAFGDEMKSFNILDGQGIKSLLKNNIEVAVITGRTSPLTEKRAKDLGIKHITQGREDKKIALLELCKKLDISEQEVAYVGDDLPDLSAIKLSSVGFTVPNAHAYIKKHADYCTNLRGGDGAVREVCDLILSAKGLFDDYYSAYLG
jgi:3-deoxy-D-manno-octulosonate 8-phosphate phosphatase (KDO 8-P phosphatase)|tara:strand:+ start:1521 stop:2060 length:540 start_codon:yes stop_codon:yes gene_type:complete